MFLFDGGELTEAETAAFRLPPDELRSWAFCTLDQASARLAPRLFRRVASCLANPGETLYLENGEAPPAT